MHHSLLLTPWRALFAASALCALTACTPDSAPPDTPAAPQNPTAPTPDAAPDATPDPVDPDAAPDLAEPDPDAPDLGAPDLDTPDLATPDLDPPDLGADQVTFAQHISPLLQAECAQCHTQGGIGPFTLKTYEEVRGLSPVILASVEARRMPPWPPADNCQEFRHERTLTEEQLQLFRDWAAQGHPQGDPASEVILPINPALELGTPDLSVDLGVDYKPAPPEREFDDYRCFIVDPGLTQERLLNASEVIPGNASIVHHVLYYAIPQNRLAHLQQLDDETPGPGYTCFGGPRVNDATLLGGWVPGSTPIQFDPDHGIPIKANERIVIQVHYNTANDEQGVDRTRINMRFAERNTTRLAMLPLAQGELNIQPGDANSVASAELQLPNVALLRSIRVYGIVPHMHELGKKIKVTIERDGADLCMVDIPAWDFNWQGFYLYQTPIRLAANDKVKLSCTYDNSMARNQQLGREPRLVTWGEGTQDEMCLAYVIVNNPGIF